MATNNTVLDETPNSSALTRQRAGRIIVVISVVLTIIIFIHLAAFFAPQISDDAFIFFRYADNLIHGKGPVWNEGERVEGFSSPLWLLLLSVGNMFGIDYIVFSRLIGMISTVLVLVGAGTLARRVGSSPWQASLSTLLVSLGYGLHYWLPAGLETPLYAAIVMWTAVTLSAGNPGVLPVMLLGIARPEGPALVLVVLLISRIIGHGDRCSIRTYVIILIPSISLLLFRISFYGDWLPNTYYAKATGVQPAQTLRGITYATHAWITVVLLAFAAVTTSRKHCRTLLPPFVFVVTLLTVITVGGGDWMWHERLLVPVIPILLVLGVSGLRASRRIVPTAASVGSILVLTTYLVPLPIVGLSLRGYELPLSLRQEGTLTDTSRQVAHWIRNRYGPEITVAVNHAGALPYYMEYRCIDMTGLNDPVIARSQGDLHGKWNPEYILDRAPELVVLNSRTEPGSGGIWYHTGYWYGETALFKHPEFQRHYRAIPLYWTWRWFGDSDNYILLYERVDLSAIRENTAAQHALDKK